jgi:DUF971 family protein
MLRALEIQKLSQALKFRWSDQTHSEIPLGWLRSHCTCAVCLEKQQSKKEIPLFSSKAEMDAYFSPEAILSVGNYGFEIVWKDKHRSIYDFDRVKISFENQSLPSHLQSLSVSKAIGDRL